MRKLKFLLAIAVFVCSLASQIEAGEIQLPRESPPPPPPVSGTVAPNDVTTDYDTVLTQISLNFVRLVIRFI